MFVHFKKRDSGGIRPSFVDARRTCLRWFATKGESRCKQHCVWKTGNCRWVIYAGPERSLKPYRLYVSLVENNRVNGKVVQSHIAQLGSIDGYLLPSIFDGIDAAIIEETTTMRLKWRFPFRLRDIVHKDWHAYSLAMRTQFLSGVNETLNRLGNRVDDVEKIIAAISARIPPP